ncbi:uncharacterized protein LOC143414581 isoform X2 [Maylandia zebra]|uniref:uncharacterized protein LOC143414581 isoform X2 n=1 Tax=Maylandia zebra TaxID=106582 RepID=UPI00403CCBE1
MHLIVRKRQPKSCWSRQDTNSPELCMNGTSGTFSTQERFILRIICASYYPAVPLSCLNLQQESRSPHMTPGAEVLSQPPSDQLMSDTPTSFFQQTPGAEVLSQPPSDQLTPSAEVLSQPPSDQLTPGAEVLSQPPSDQLTPGAEVLSQPPSDQLTPGAEVLPQPPSDQLTPGAEVLSQPPSDQLMSDTPTSFFQQTPGAEVLPQPPSDQLTPGAEVLPQPPSDQLVSDTPTSFFQQTPGAEVLSQPPSDQLAQGPSILGVPSHTLYSAALDNMKGTSASITLNNKNISNTSPRRGVLFCTACEPNQSLWLEINTERGIVTSCCTPDLGR